MKFIDCESNYLKQLLLYRHYFAL